MTLKLVSLIVGWLRRILSICPRKRLVQEQRYGEIKEAASSLKETGTGVATLQEKRATEPLEIKEEVKEKGKIIQTDEHEEKLVEDERTIVTPENKATSIEATQYGEKAANEREEKQPDAGEVEREVAQGEGSKKGLWKPYKKKSPTGEGGRRSLKESDIKKQRPVLEKRKPIFLGDLPRRRRRLKDEGSKARKGRDTGGEKAEEVQEEERTATVVQSPFVEIDLDNAEVSLVLPKQELEHDSLEKNTSLMYAVEINGKSNKIPSSTAVDKEGKTSLREKRILLEESLNSFVVKFPDELQAKEFNYSQKSREFYAFIATGDNHGRLFYLNDSNGNINPLPGREMWIVLRQDFELGTEPEVTEEKWVWEEYQPFRVNLGETETLIVKNKKTGKQKEFSSENTFRIEGKEEEGLVEDDFRNECPLFTCSVLRILPPNENPSGWSVWLQNKEAGSRLICKNWTGSDFLELKLPEDIPCEFGEFQIDICQGNTRIADETLFFRLMPPIELDYPKTLIIPDPEIGHTPSLIKIRLLSDDKWELKQKEGEKFKSLGRNYYEVEVPPEEDTFCFSAAVSGKPESSVNFRVSIPRLKWKISGKDEWQSKPQGIERKNLKPGEPLYLFVSTNDFRNKYDILGILETNSQRLQEGRFVRKGTEYWLEMNAFYDTIQHNKMGLILRAEIRRMKETQLFGSIEAVYFDAEQTPEKKKPLRPPKVRESFPYIRAFVRYSRHAPEKKGKGFSKKEIIAAGLSIRDARRFGIPYDRRRKSSYPRNINTLEKRFKREESNSRR